METCWSLILFANIVFKYIYKGMESLVRKDTYLKMMKEGAIKSPTKIFANESERQLVVAVHQGEVVVEKHGKNLDNKNENGVEYF